MNPLPTPPLSAILPSLGDYPVDRIGSFLEELLAIPSPSGQEGRLAAFLEERFSGDLGFKVERQSVEANRCNLLVSTGATPVVLLSTHLDTVPPELPYSFDGQVIRGRGACDAKGCLAAMTEAVLRLRERGERRVGLLLVVGEETNSDGAKAAAGLKPGSRFIVVGEPTGNRLVAGQKGSLVFRLQVEGIAGHSAYPEHGRSAVHDLAGIVSRWTGNDWGADPLFGANTLNFGTFSGGSAANVIAGSAEATGIFRVATSLDEVLDRVRVLLPETAKFQVLSAAAPLRLMTVPGFAQTVVSFGSDAPYLTSLGRVLMMGPGSILYAHGSEEQITLQELEEGAAGYVALVDSLLGSG